MGTTDVVLVLARGCGGISGGPGSGAGVAVVVVTELLSPGSGESSTATLR